MEKYYTINEVAMISGLSTRTLRNYLKINVLQGEKVDGTWKFTEENLNEFLSNPYVKPSIKAKNKAVIYDFLVEDKKRENVACHILDAYVEDDEAKEISEFFCNKINQNPDMNNLKFSFEKNGKNVRVILSGYEECVWQLLNDYYNR